MADKYRRIEKTQDALPENEIRVRKNAGIGRYLKRAVELFNTTKEPIVIKGVSNAMESVVKLAELIKHRVKGLYQISSIENIKIVDEYEPLEEGLDHLKFERVVTMLTITLSNTPLDQKDVGYQDPIPDAEVSEYTEQTQRRDGESGGRRFRGGFRGGFRGNFRGGRGGDRGGRGRSQGRPTRPYDNEEGGDLFQERRGRGGYRGNRGNYGGRGRGGYGERSNTEGRPYNDRTGGERIDYRGGERQNYRGGDKQDFRGERQDYRGEGQDRGDRQDYRGGYNRGGRGGYENRGGRGGYENRGGRGGYENRGGRGGYTDRGGRGERRGYNNYNNYQEGGRGGRGYRGASTRGAETEY